jgi:hypothetical protein
VLVAALGLPPPDVYFYRTAASTIQLDRIQPVAQQHRRRKTLSPKLGNISRFKALESFRLCEPT